MEKKNEDKLIILETKLAYLEDFMNQLQSVTVDQSKAIERLETENRILSGKISELQESLEDIPNRKPPHY